MGYNNRFQVNKKTVATFSVLLLFLCIIFPGCTKESKKEVTVHSYTDLNSKEALYIYEGFDKEKSEVYLVNPETGADATFVYSGRTEVLTDKGENTVVDSLKCGELIKLVYSLNDNILNYIHVASDSWSYETLGAYINADAELGAMKVEDTTYKMNTNYMVYSHDKRITIDSVVEKDKIVVRGVGNMVYSLTVTSGHGTVELKGLEAYEGGWIEIGKVITVIQKDMVLDVPEGEYKVVLTRKGCKGEALISVARDERSVIEAENVTETKTLTGMITFQITPETANASIYLNGARVTTNEPIERAYGRYYITVKAEGYTTFGGTLQLNSSSTTVSIELTKSSSGGGTSGSTTSGSGSGTTSSGSSTESTTSTMNSSERQSVLESIQNAMNSAANSLYNLTN